MVDGEDYIYNKGVINISRFGEEVGEEKGGKRKEIEILVLFKEKDI